MLNKVCRRASLICAGIVAALIAGEAAVSVGYWVVRRQRFPSTEYRRALFQQSTARTDLPVTEPGGAYTREFIHPYLGFVPDPSIMRGGVTIGDPAQVLAPSPHERIVGVFGGSFAAGLCAYAAGELRRVLAQPGKRVHLLCIAAGGYKQPQQFLALAYLLAQGAHFDLVLNVDGFNEVALAPFENTPQGVAPIYPRDWVWRVGNLEDPDALRLIARIDEVERARRRWAERIAGWGLYRSNLLLQVWQSRDHLLLAESRRLSAALSEEKVARRKNYGTTGPAMPFESGPALYEYLVTVWVNSSLQMKRLCDANGIAYAHVLQPNQYVRGSKPMDADERRVAIGTGHYAEGASHGYPLLRQRGGLLRSAGVNFHDLTMIFKTVAEPVYKDDCCHLTGAGYRMVARTIGERLAADAPRSSEPATPHRAPAAAP